MKKLFLFTTLLLLFLSPAVAGNGNGLSNSISKQLQVPAQLKGHKLNEKVSVQFKVLPGGSVLLMNVDSQHPELKAYIEKQFPKINAAELKPDGTYFIDINFKVL